MARKMSEPRSYGKKEVRAVVWLGKEDAGTRSYIAAAMLCGVSFMAERNCGWDGQLGCGVVAERFRDLDVQVVFGGWALFFERRCVLGVCRLVWCLSGCAAGDGDCEACESL